MHHFFEAITNTRGDSLPGYFARVIDAANGNAVVSIHADNSGTAIETVSGVANMARTDAEGNLSFYVAPGTYHLDLYGTDATSFVRRVANVAMAGDITEAAQAALEAAQAAADAAGQSKNAAASSASAAADSLTAAETAASTAAASANVAAGNANAATSASAAAGAYPNLAAAHVPRGLTQSSVGAITGGSGGANGTFALTWSGGNFGLPPTGTFTVAGGALTFVTITGPGLYIGASPSVPTPGFGASAGLTGAGVALTAQSLIGSGHGYWALSADGARLDRYVNSGGTATLDLGTGAIVTSSGLANVVSGVSGGRTNIFPDPFFTHYGRWERLNVSELPYIFQAGWNIETARGASPYPDGKQARTTGTASLYQEVYLPNVGLSDGDVFQAAWSIAISSGSYSAGAFASYAFYAKSGAALASGSLFTASAGYPLNQISKPFISPDLTVPIGAYRFRLAFNNFAAVDVYVDAMWMHQGKVPISPTDIPLLPDGPSRVGFLEDSSPGMNNVTLRRVTHAGRSLALGGASGAIQYGSASLSGFAQSLLTNGVPESGFNAVEFPYAWIVGQSSPTFLFVEVRTIASIAGIHPVNGRTVARGFITLDPTSGGGENYVILLRDPLKGTVKIVIPNDLEDRYTIAAYAVNASGVAQSNSFFSLGTGTISNLDNAYPDFYDAGANRGGGITGSGRTFGVNHLLLTSPAETWKTSSSEFAASVLQAAEGSPLLIALPKKIWGVVGRETHVYWAQVQQRDPKDVNFSVSGLSTASFYEEGIKYVPSGAGTVSATISSALGNNPRDMKVVDFVSAAVSAAPGNKVCLFIGDSLIGNQGMLGALKAIEASQSVTNLTFIGTQGGAGIKNEGYSGQDLGAFFGTTIGGNSNPFYGGGTFSFSAFKAHATIAAQLATAGVAEPHFVFIEAGKVGTGAAGSDGAAQGFAIAYASTLETMIANILASTTSTKVVVYTAEPGPVPTSENIAYGPLWRVRRNWMILASQQISQFSGREGSRVYVTATGCAIDPVTGWPRSFQPRSASVTRDMATYTSYGTMHADLSKTTGSVAFVTDVGAYFIKVGNAGTGYWRAAAESDGFAWRSTDSIHYSDGCKQVAEANWAVIKNLG